VRHAAFYAFGAYLSRRGFPGLDHFSASDEFPFAVDDDEDVVGLRMHFRATLHGAIGDHNQAFVFDDATALVQFALYCNLVDQF
jgi:hypothetical protein